MGGRIINNGSISAHVAAAELRALHRDQARDHRPHEIDVARRPQVRHRLRTDRHRQRRDRHDGALRDRHAAGERRASKIEPRIDVTHVVDAVLFMAGLPLDANVQFLTVMATKMPFIGRG